MSRKNSHTSDATVAAQALHYIDEATGAVTPPIHTSVTFARDENYELRSGYMYSRYGTPTSDKTEEVLAKLEGAADTLIFNSGLSACAAVIECLPVGAHVVVPDVCYFGVLVWMQRQVDKGILRLTTYRAGDLDSLRDAVQDGDTALVWVETPANPTWAVTDIAAAAEIAHSAGAQLLVDGTIAPPCTTKALELGADFAFHSATKYLNGHSDVTAGALSISETSAQWDEIREVRKLHGTALPGFEAWLLLRGMRTLFVRYAEASKNAILFAQHFEGHDLIEAVLYPGLESHNGHAVAKAQMTNGFGGMLSLLVKGDQVQSKAVAEACEVFLPATSLGGVESLIEHRITIEGPDFGTPPNLLRLSIGIEHAGDLIADMEQALARALS